MLLKYDSYTEWKNIGKCLNLSETTLEKISSNVDGFEDKDKRAFLLVLATWRERGAKKKETKIANWRNLKKSISHYSDLIKAIEEIDKGYSSYTCTEYTYCTVYLFTFLKKLVTYLTKATIGLVLTLDSAP